MTATLCCGRCARCCARSGSPTSTPSMRCGPTRHSALPVGRHEIPREPAAEVIAASAGDSLAAASESGGSARTRRAAAGFSGGLPAEEREPGADLRAARPPWWGRGLAADCATAVLDRVFDSADHSEACPRSPTRQTRHRSADGAFGMTFERRGELNGLDTVFYRLSPRRLARPARGGGGARGVLDCDATSPPATSRSCVAAPRLADFPVPAWRTPHEIGARSPRD